jgi:hypothetical protein
MTRKRLYIKNIWHDSGLTLKVWHDSRLTLKLWHDSGFTLKIYDMIADLH